MMAKYKSFVRTTINTASYLKKPFIGVHIKQKGDMVVLAGYRNGQPVESDKMDLSKAVALMNRLATIGGV